MSYPFKNKPQTGMFPHTQAESSHSQEFLKFSVFLGQYRNSRGTENRIRSEFRFPDLYQYVQANGLIAPWLPIPSENETKQNMEALLTNLTALLQSSPATEASGQSPEPSVRMHQITELRPGGA